MKTQLQKLVLLIF